MRSHAPASRRSSEHGGAARRVLLLLVLLVALLYALPHLLPSEGRIADWVARQLEARLDRPVHLEAAHWSILPLAVNVEGLRVGAAPETHLEMAALRIGVRVLPMFRRHLVVDRLILDRPRVVVGTPRETGAAPAAPPRSASPAPSATPGGMALTIERIEIVAGRIELPQGEGTLALPVDAELQVESDASGRRIELRGHLRSAWAADGRESALALRLEPRATIDLPDSTLRLDPSRIRVGPIEASLRGDARLRAGLRGHATLEVERAPLDAVMREIRLALDREAREKLEGVEVSGDLVGRFEFSIEPGADLADALPSGSLRSRQGRLRLPAHDAPVEFRLELACTPPQLSLHAVARDAADSLQVTARAALRADASTGPVRLEVWAASLDATRYLPAPARAAHVAEDAAPQPPASAGALPRLPALPPLPLEATAELGVLRLPEARVESLRVHLAASPDSFRARLAAARLETPDLGLGTATLQLAGTPERAQGSLRARHARLQSLRGTGAQARVELRPDVLHLGDVRARMHGGWIRGELTASRKSASAPVQEDVQVVLEDVQASGLLEDLVRRGDWVEGRLQGSAALRFPLGDPRQVRAHVSGGGRGSTLQGRLRVPLLQELSRQLGLPQLQTLAFQEMPFEFEVDEGWVRLPRTVVRGKDADLELHGGVGLDGRLDMRLGVKLAAALGARLQRGAALAGFERLLADPTGRVVLDFQVAGTLEAPRLRPDPDATARRAGLRALDRVRTRLQDEATSAADSIARALRDRARQESGRALRGLLQRGRAQADSTARP